MQKVVKQQKCEDCPLAKVLETAIKLNRQLREMNRPISMVRVTFTRLQKHNLN